MSTKPDLLASLAATMERQVQTVSESPVAEVPDPEAPFKTYSGSPNIKLKPVDDARLAKLFAHALTEFGERLSFADAFRLALHGWDYRTLTREQIAGMRRRDRRRTRRPSRKRN